MMAGSSALAALLVLTCIILPFCAAQVSCRGRCGESYMRGQACNCDYDCLSHNECCQDFQTICTSSNSCKGRCGETFQRSRQCDCDPDCVLYKTCCPDHQTQCTGERATRPTTMPVITQKTTSRKDSKKNKPKESSKKKTTKKPDLKPLVSTKKPSNSESEEITQDFPAFMSTPPLPVQHIPVVPDQVAKFGPEVPPQNHFSVSDPTPTLGPENMAANDSWQTDTPIGSTPWAGMPVDLPISVPVSVALEGPEQQTVAPVPAVDSSPMQAALQSAPGTDEHGPPSEKPISLSVSLIISPAGPSALPDRPSTLTDIAQSLLTHSPAGSLADDYNSTDLCSGLAIDGIINLPNNTSVVFRGHFFWMVDANKVPGPAQRITEVWGIPSPIDAVFTRCDCQGKTYFIKGNNYWRFDNGVMDPGYPKKISAGFHGLSGSITAALSVPANRKRPESVFFFKKGGQVQKYTYQPRGSPTCVPGVRDRLYRQEAIRSGKAINIKLTWKGFPSLVTAAVSIPAPEKPDGYDYYIFSGSKYYNIILDGEGLSVIPPQTPPSQQDARTWFKCR